MENRKKCRMIYLGILFYILLMFSSCLNYIPCRGQDYIIKGITHQELIGKFNELREEFPEYAVREDYIDEYLPRYYIALHWKDLDMNIYLNIHIGDQIPNPPTHLKFVSIKDSTGFKAINSKEFDKILNERYKKKFEMEILDKFKLLWRRDDCK